MYFARVASKVINAIATMLALLGAKLIRKTPIAIGGAMIMYKTV
jgi:hypothetical protein